LSPKKSNEHTHKKILLSNKFHVILSTITDQYTPEPHMQVEYNPYGA